MDLSKEFFVQLPCYGTLGQKICRALPTKSNIRERKKEMATMLPVWLQEGYRWRLKLLVQIGLSAARGKLNFEHGDKFETNVVHVLQWDTEEYNAKVQ